MAGTWLCPICQRRVPMAVGICRCGASRNEAAAAEELRTISRGGAVRRRDEPLPLAVKAWLAVMAVALVGGIVASFRPFEPQPIVPLLGWVDNLPPTAPPPPPRPTSR